MGEKEPAANGMRGEKGRKGIASLALGRGKKDMAK